MGPDPELRDAIRAKATEIFGSASAAEAWLRTEAMALDWRRPLDLLKTDEGALAVQLLLKKIEHGVYI